MPDWLPPFLAAASAIVVLNLAWLLQRRLESRTWDAEFLRELRAWDGRVPRELNDPRP